MRWLANFRLYFVLLGCGLSFLAVRSTFGLIDCFTNFEPEFGWMVIPIYFGGSIFFGLLAVFFFLIAWCCHSMKKIQDEERDHRSKEYLSLDGE